MAENSNRKCLVTGASRGIGRRISEELTSCGFSVIGLARSRPDWWKGEFVEADLGDQASIESACQTITTHGPYWGLVNNAGMGKSGPIDALTFEDMTKVFVTNCFAPALIT